VFGWGRRIKRAVHEALGSDRHSRFALNDLDRKLLAYCDGRDGFFIEAGANDGLSQSNTYWLERFRGWRGLLVEGVPELAAAARRNRPRATVVNAALVGDPSVTEVTMRTANLMSIVKGARGSEASDDAHVRSGAAVQPGAEVREIRVPARTLTSILDELRPPRIDLFSLDVEGYELEVLRGLDLARHRPRWILVETAQAERVDALLGGAYERVALLSEHDHLYRCRDPLTAPPSGPPRST
jgi:FkbM family methyltransferase